MAEKCPTGETPAAEPTTTVKLPDAVSLKMLETENAILRRRLDECRPYLKDGETPAQCIKRNRADVDVALGLLAKEKQKAESAAPSAGPDLREQIEAFRESLLKIHAKGCACFGCTIRQGVASELRDILLPPAPAAQGKAE